MSAVKEPPPLPQPQQQQPPPHVFLQTLNPMRGKMEWKPQPIDYDYKQEVARAAFADMLHDTERNHLYYVGLEAAIRKKRKEGAKVHVLDIGTGTGLLSMMAVRLGADTITAIEEFAPMANCAEKVTRLNGCWDRINLIRKRSTGVCRKKLITTLQSVMKLANSGFRIYSASVLVSTQKTLEWFIQNERYILSLAINLVNYTMLETFL